MFVLFCFGFLFPVFCLFCLFVCVCLLVCLVVCLFLWVFHCVFSFEELKTARGCVSAMLPIGSFKNSFLFVGPTLVHEFLKLKRLFLDIFWA